MKKTTLSYTLLLLFAFIGYLTVSGSQSVTRLSSLRVSATSEIPALGASELGQQPGIRSADRHHLALRYQDAVWQIANISPGKKVDVRTDKRDTLFLKRLPLEQNDEIQLGHNLLKVTAVSDDSISLTSPTTGNTAEWRNGILFLKGQTVYPASWWNLFKQRQRGSKALFRHPGTTCDTPASVEYFLGKYLRHSSGHGTAHDVAFFRKQPLSLSGGSRSNFRAAWMLGNRV